MRTFYLSLVAVTILLLTSNNHSSAQRLGRSMEEGSRPIPKASLLSRLSQVIRTSCDTEELISEDADQYDCDCDLDGGCDGESLSSVGCDECGEIFVSESALSRLISLFQTDCCDALCGGPRIRDTLHAHLHTPKRAGGGPFRKHGPCWYTAPTEWTLFGVFPLPMHPGCIEHGTCGGAGCCDVDSGCAVYDPDHVGSDAADGDVVQYKTAGTSPECETVMSAEGSDKETSSHRKFSGQTQSRKKSILLRQGNVTRTTYRDVIRMSHTEGEYVEPGMFANLPESLDQEQNEPEVLPAVLIQKALDNSTPTQQPSPLTRSTYGKATMKIVE